MKFAFISTLRYRSRSRKEKKTKKTILTLLKNPLKEVFCSLLRKILQTFKKKKGSLRDPFLYLGLISVILLSILVFFTPSFLTKLNLLDSTKNLQASLVNLNLTRDFISQETNNHSKNDGLFVGLINNSFKESPDLVFVQKNSLMAVTPPNLITSQTLGSLVSDQDDEFWAFRREIIEYTVQSGDSLTSIAEKFNISLETLLWANDLNKNSKIKPNQSLVILPVSGVIHYVKKGDTLAGIAKTYKSEVSKIIAFNELSEEDDIYIGDILVIPDGVIPSKPKQQIAKKSLPSNQIPITSSYFIVPVSSPYLITQGLHWYNAVDLGHPGGSCGKPVFAGASGEVVKTKYGWNAGAGNNVSILHPNGVVTVYYHLQTILVKPGQEVLPGDQIGTMGKTGITTGCHLHFGVIGAKNPFAR